MAALEKDAQILQQSLWDGSLRPWIAMDPVRPSNWLVAHRSGREIAENVVHYSRNMIMSFQESPENALIAHTVYCIFYVFVILP